ncbi:MAG: bifunctional oligoribonuclease/PAP phosphatase NrnA [Desulfobacterales bacterium]|nr:bifunctional oligoribonuclease/PAP phosphatase NrnA [Desulfobacterales bacterium]
MDHIRNHLKNSRRVLLVSHVNPDGDAIGSLIAMGLALEAMGLSATLCNASPIPAVYRFLPAVQRITDRIDGTQTYDTAMVLDCGDLKRVGNRLMEAINRIPIIVNVDHHITNTGFGHLQQVEPFACATAEIVYRLIRSFEVPVSRSIATAIYTGILTDTGSFRFANTNRAAFRICEEMVALGVDPSKVAQHVYGTYSLGRIKLLNLALDSIEISNNGKLSLMCLSQGMLQETGTQSEDADGLINYARSIRNVKLAAMIQERPNSGTHAEGEGRYHVSMRSDGTVDVSEIASYFGGGGHVSAAGFTIESTLSNIKSEIMGLADTL